MSGSPHRIVRTIELLDLRATDRVLEVGCGNGQALALMAGAVTRGMLFGIDRSALQVKAARARNQRAMATGRMKVEQLELDDAPELLVERFDKVVAVNVNAFWTDPERSLTSASRLLRPRGRLYLTYETPSAARARELATKLPEILPLHRFAVLRKELEGAHFAVSARPSSARSARGG